MITSSGSEGISLKNVNYVHIFDPYWHPVRREQVIGRARRICSHEELEKEKQFVKVFIYLMKLTEEQYSKDSSRELRRTDFSVFDKRKYITTDEKLHEISEVKRKVNQSILKCVKETSIDCNTYKSENEKEEINCFTFPRTTHQTFSYQPSIKEEEEDIDKGKIIKWRAKALESKGYAIRIDENGNYTDMVYDLVSYKKALKNPNIEPELIGTFQIVNGKGKVTLFSEKN